MNYFLDDHYLFENENFQILNVTKDDEGIYLCKRFGRKFNKLSQKADFVVRIREPIVLQLNEETPSYLIESNGKK